MLKGERDGTVFCFEAGFTGSRSFAAFVGVFSAEGAGGRVLSETECVSRAGGGVGLSPVMTGSSAGSGGAMGATFACDEAAGGSSRGVSPGGGGVAGCSFSVANDGSLRPSVM